MNLRQPAFGVITVGGTNGKGSTVTMCDAILRAAGFSVGSYTSPHLVHYNERIRINGRLVTDDELCRAFERVEAARGDIALTYFEYGTIAAFDIFRECAIEIAVLEIGMGGRLDAVNAVDADVAIVTSIGIDHTAWLGPDRESIGREKAGIFRAGRPAVCADPAPPASLVETAAKLGTTLYCFGRDFDAGVSDAGWSLRFGQRLRAGLPFPALRGEHQLRNASAALVALELLGDRFPVNQQDIRQGLLAAVIPGRFQILPGTPAIIIDVAHNGEAAQTLAANLRRHQTVGKTLAVFGMLNDKDIGEVIRVVAGSIDRWYVATLSGPRGTTAAQVTQLLTDNGITAPIAPFATPIEAYNAARAAAAPPDRVVVFGSFHTVGDILAHLEAGPA